MVCSTSGDSIYSNTSVESIKMGTTVATNALLERKGEPTVLAVTKGLKVLYKIILKGNTLEADLGIGFTAYW